MAIAFNVKPYWDDFNTAGGDELTPKEKYQRVLFRPGNAIQARELTQLQTILQHQVSSLGDHLFKDGSVVVPGAVHLHNKIDYVKLDSVNAACDTVTELVGTEFTDGTNVAKVIHAALAIGSDSITIWVQYISGTVFADNVTITATGGKSAEVKASAATGFGSVVSIEDGIYYIKKHMVVAKAKTIVLSKYTSDVSFDIGLLVTEKLVGPGDDISLNDNAQGTPNTSAPGAHRYSVTAVLSTQAVNSTTGNFVLIARLENGVTVKHARTADYSLLEDELARRTFDESGNYYVNPFKALVKKHTVNVLGGAFVIGSSYEIISVGTTDFTIIGAAANAVGAIFTATGVGTGTGIAILDTKLTIAVDPSTAYVRGYEIQKLSTTNLHFDKARSSERVTDKVTEISHNNYIEVTSMVGVPDLTTHGKISIQNASSGEVGTCRARSIERVSGSGASAGSRYRIHIFEFTGTMALATKLVDKDTQTIANATNYDFTGTIADSGAASAYNIGSDSLVYKLPYDRIKTCDTKTDGSAADYNYKFNTNRIISGTDVTSGQATFTTTVAFETFGERSNNINWILINDDDQTVGGEVVDINNISFNAALTTATITGLSAQAGDTLRLIAPFERTATHKTKVISGDTAVAFLHSNSPDYTGDGMALGHADVHKLVSVVETSGSADVTKHFEIDDGQRDTHYDLGRIKLKTTSNYTAAVNLTVTYKYFTHGILGDFFTVDSYLGQINYADIPSYDLIELRSAVDFRPRIDNAGAGFTGGNAGTARLSATPRRYSQFKTDIQFYLPRMDKVWLDSKGDFGVTPGVPAAFPEAPGIPKDAMHLYTVSVAPYTLTPSEVGVAYIDQKRYTMRDIGHLDKRVGQVEYYAALNFLETEAQNTQILDTNNNPRWKSGYLVDGFANTRMSKSWSPEYRAAVDIPNRTLRAPFSQGNAAMTYHVASSGTTKTGDLVTLPYTHADIISQTQYSGSINVNPYNVFNWSGSMALSPSTDEWIDIDRRPEVTINNDGEFDAMKAALEPEVGTVWGAWQTHWTGAVAGTRSSTYTPGVMENVGGPAGGYMRRGKGSWSHSSSGGTARFKSGKSRTGVQTTIAVDTSLVSQGDRVVAVNFVPYMRTRLVHFSATRLKPATQVYAYFDGIAVASYVNEAQPGYTPLVGVNTEVAHPSGAGDLITDANGAVTGSFLIPNNIATNFTAGTKEFKLTSSAVNDDVLMHTSAIADYTAAGLIETREHVVLSTRTPRIVRTPTDTGVLAWADPLAQSILLDKSAFVTKLDLYFTNADAAIPVQIQIRKMVNGFPTQEVLPFSDVTLNPWDGATRLVNVDGTATTFTFDSPVFLQDGVEYAIVILANSNNYTVRYAEIGDEDAAGNRISAQPYNGVLFKSQNASTWTADQNKDLTFVLKRAVFDTTSRECVLRNAVLPSRQLVSDPLTTVASTASAANTFTCAHRDHGMKVTDTVTFAGFAATNGYSAAELNKTHTIVSTTRDSYTITTAAGSPGGHTNAITAGNGGGVDAKATQNLAWNTMLPILQQLTLPKTGQSWTVLDTLESVGTLADADQVSAIVPNENYTPIYPKVIKSGSTHTIELNGTFTSTSDYLSPVIDLERCSVITIANRIDNNAGGVAETTASTGSSLAKYVTKTVELADSSDTIKVYVDINRPNSTFVDLYYKSGNTAATFDAQSWVLALDDLGAVAYSDEESYNETVYTIAPAATFTLFAIKMVMRSESTSIVPKIQQLRAIACKV